MARIRLRDLRESTQAEAAFYQRRYPNGYQHIVWPDHVERIAESVRFLAPWVTGRGMVSAADLSCGDGALIRRLPWPIEVRTMGDLVPAAHLDVHGPLPDTLDLLEGAPVDLYLCSETLEHLPDPDGLLARVAELAHHVFISTPVAESPHTGNEEHYWSWDTGDVRDMLLATGWQPLAHEVFRPDSTRHMDDAYRYQLWLAERQTA